MRFPVLALVLLGLTVTAATHARPIDLSIPSGGHGPIDSRGYAQQWVQLTSVDFGGGLSLPLRLSFLSSRTGQHGFGEGLWQSPLLESKFISRSATQWQVLLPCGKILTLVPQKEGGNTFATYDQEWTGVVKGPRTLILRADGWEMEFDKRGLLMRLRTDAGRTVLWNRLADGSVRTLNEVNGSRIVGSGLTVTWDSQARRVTSMDVRTATGVKSWSLTYEPGGSGRLTAVIFPDRGMRQFIYSTDSTGNPSVIFRGLAPTETTLVWHRTFHTLVSDGVWTYSFKREKANIYPVTTRIGARGEKEVYHDDVKNGRTLFTRTDGTLTIRQHVTANGPAHGKLLSVARQPPGTQEALTIYQARYDLQSGQPLEENVSLSGHHYSRKASEAGVLEEFLFSPSNVEAVRMLDKEGKISALDLKDKPPVNP